MAIMFVATMAYAGNPFSVNPLQVAGIYEHIHHGCGGDCKKVSVIYFAGGTEDEAVECTENRQELSDRWNAAMNYVA